MRRLLPILFCLSFFPSLTRASENTFFTSKDVKLYYSIEGQGQPVLLIHGFAVNSQVQWALPGIVKELARDYQVISLDNRGHGRSSKPHDPKQYGTEMVEDAVRLLDHLHIAKAHVVGYSMGGFIALKLAATHPDRVLTVTTGGAGWSERTDHAFLDELADSLEQGKGLGPLLVALTPEGQPKPTDVQLKNINRISRVFFDAKALAALVRAYKGLELSAGQLRNIHEPVLALVGSRDPFKAGVDALTGQISDLRIVVIPRADHMDAFKKPEFIRALKAFLTEHTMTSKSPVGAGR
jgi:pimeloyl-ACP methyl ester carboxylesterase